MFGVEIYSFPKIDKSPYPKSSATIKIIFGFSEKLIELHEIQTVRIK